MKVHGCNYFILNIQRVEYKKRSISWWERFSHNWKSSKGIEGYVKIEVIFKVQYLRQK